ncbi:hypothetical protein KGM_206179 [Danaus plexippus plexippus]|uniref:Uncharacterized protein n=1 Tax=Danaus plexippus plexippus TaxID=278856 RepID=A0A212F294_DANPL|nr:hypothetical protein KGM_206179 [Danaus plexippus plexippus]
MEKPSIDIYCDHHIAPGIANNGKSILVAGMEDVWVELRAPRFVVHGHSAVFRCEHNVDPQTLYKVVFFKSGQRIMQYVQGRDPQFERYNFTGADINTRVGKYEK